MKAISRAYIDELKYLQQLLKKRHTKSQRIRDKFVKSTIMRFYALQIEALRNVDKDSKEYDIILNMNII